MPLSPRAGQGGCAVLANRFCFNSSDSAWNTTPGRDLERAGLDTISIDHGPHVQALQEPAPRDVLGQFLDRDASLDAPHIGLAQVSLSKGMSRDGDRVTFWAAFAIRSSPRRAPEATLPISFTVTPQRPNLSLSSSVSTAVKKCKLHALWGVEKTWGSCGPSAVCDGCSTIKDGGPCDGYTVSPFGRPPHPSPFSYAGISNVID